jgi:hypothetical protein
VDVNLALVVGGTTAVDITVSSLGFERRGGPKIKRLGRLNVVMSVEKDGRFARGFQRLGVDERVKISGDDLDFLEAGAPKVVGYPFGGAFYVGLMFRFRADGRDAKKLAKFDQMLLAPTFDKFSKVHIRPSGTRILFPNNQLSDFREIAAAEWIRSNDWLPLPLN